MIKIVDCGSQLTQNIARRIRDFGVYAEIVSYKTPASEIKTKDLEGIIISGGQFSVYDSGAPKFDKEILELGVPSLGICYGLQSIADFCGGKVSPTQNREYGKTKIFLKEFSKLLEIRENNLNVWMSHGDIVERLPQGFVMTAVSESGHIAAMENKERRIYAVQFHPEVDHTDYGKTILENFLFICEAKRTWDPSKQYEKILENIKEKAGGKVGIGGISGGVDSSVASVLVGKAAGKNYHPIFVDNGLLRLNEAEQVRRSLEPFGLDIRYVDASARFLDKLKGITDPDEKRKIIGHEFIAVFEEVARGIEDASYLVQGTLYPDVIESVPVYGSSSKIKRHHNVGGLPEKMGLKVLEPFRQLFKDEVRKIGDRLELPREIVWRHPFPGPGLAVRIIGDITERKLDLLRKADYIFIDELRNRNLYDKISQALVVLTNAQSTGVLGDEGKTEYVAALRAVVTNDFMTSDIFRFDWGDLQAITNRIVNEVKGINRVVYDTTQKPPATIEWE